MHLNFCALFLKVHFWALLRKVHFCALFLKVHFWALFSKKCIFAHFFLKSAKSAKKCEGDKYSILSRSSRNSYTSHVYAHRTFHTYLNILQNKTVE